MDHRADIYALGVMLYQMLTGELPGTPLELPSRKVRIDVRLDEVVLRALEREPDRRYQQAGQMKTHLETISATLQDDRRDAAQSDTEGGKRSNARKSADNGSRPESWETGTWSRRVFWIIATGFAVPIGLILLSLLLPQLAREGAGATGIVVIIGVMIGIGLGLVAVLVGLLRAFKTREADLANPWPRRIVVMLAAVVLAPISLFVVASLVYLAASRAPMEPGDSGVLHEGANPDGEESPESSGVSDRSEPVADPPPP